MKLRATKRLRYARRDLKPGDVFDAESDFDARVLTCEIDPHAEYITEEESEAQGKHVSSDVPDSSEKENVQPDDISDDKENTKKAPRRRAYRRPQAKGSREVGSLTRRY